jgi:hypothetical protein
LVAWVRRTFLPQDKSLRGPSLRDLMTMQKPAPAGAAPLMRAEDLAGGSAADDPRAAANRRTLARLAPLFLIAGVALVVFGVRQTQAQQRLQDAGIRAAGVVSALVSSHDSNSHTYHARVVFTDRAGQRRQFTDRVGASPPLYRAGEAVTVLYLPAEPGGAMIDRGAWNWLGPGLLFLCGGGLALLGGALLRGRGTELAFRPDGSRAG